jgi:hypothetical protein
MDRSALEYKLVCSEQLADHGSTFLNSISIIDGTSGGRLYGVGHTGHRLYNIARYVRGPASLG